MNRRAWLMTVPVTLLVVVMLVADLAVGDGPKKDCKNCNCINEGQQAEVPKVALTTSAAPAQMLVGEETPTRRIGINLSGPGDSVQITVQSYSLGYVIVSFEDCCVSGDTLRVRGGVPAITRTGSQKFAMPQWLSFKPRTIGGESQYSTRVYTVSFQDCPNGYPAGFYCDAIYYPFFTRGTERMFETAAKAFAFSE